MSSASRSGGGRRQTFKGRRAPLRWDAETEGQILEYLRELAQRLGKGTVTTRDVKADGRVSPATIHRRFGGFSEALIRAGLPPVRTYKRNRTTMLAELANLMSDLGRPPSKTEVKKNLSYSVRHFEQEFGSLEHACKQAASIQHSATASNDTGSPRLPLPLTRAKGRRRYGAAIDFRGLRHAPINELGVVLLFGMLAEQLGFVVESVQEGFPDCDAKLRREDGTFEGVRIEFEFRSSEFRRHRHDPSACDLIVCWVDDWPDSPVQVIALSEIVARSRGGKSDA